MKTLWSLWLAVFFSWASVSGISAEVLPKDVIEVKEVFNKNGATSCSQAMADTINFLAHGRSFTYNALWGTTDADNKPISMDFSIYGSKDDYSSNGSIVLIPIRDKCIGVYVYSYVAPSHNCTAYIQKTGFDNKEMIHNSTTNNGEGGTVHFLSLRNIHNINFIFNDVAGGCSLTIREMLTLDAKM